MVDNNTLEESLNLVIEDLYQGLMKLADKARDGESPEGDLRDLAGDLCRHWPNCRSAHNLGGGYTPQPDK